MSDSQDEPGSDGTGGFTGAGGPDFGRAALAVCCALVVVFASLLVPLVGAGGLAQSPLGSALPVPGFTGDSAGSGTASGQPTAGEGTTSGQRLGALNPGSQTGVGGSLAEENATNPFQTLGNETHFVVSASRSTYWRTGSYDRYLGEGWEQTGESRPYDPPIETRGLPGEELRYEVTLRQSAAGLPTAWRPERVSLTRPLDLQVTSGSAVTVAEPVPAGTTFEAVSSVPVRDVSTLRATGREYPTGIEERYTQLPDSTRERLAPFVANLTDTRNPYETARTVERWLESEKGYSLNVSDPPSDDVATQFVFEMDEGYCEYFATSMVAMLRSQGVPARYVVGYSPGQPSGPSEYTVRGMNAHAWVEVYFADVGWVRFDPTPAGERVAAEREALNESDPDEATPTPTPTATPAVDPGSRTPTSTPVGGVDVPTPTESGSGGTATPSAPATATPPPDGTPAPTGTPTPSVSVELNRTAVPGATVEVTVTRGSDPLEGALVRFNGEAIGRTDANGTVVGTVPYASELRIDVEGTTQSFSIPPPDGRQYAVDGGVPLPPSLEGVTVPAANATQEGDNTTVSYPLDRNASVSVAGDRVTGGEVVVSAAVEDVPVRDGTVTLNGEPVGTTNRNGRLTLTLPSEPGNVTVAVERGEVRGETSFRLRELNVSVEPRALLALPFTTATVTTRIGDEPAAGVNVSVANETVGETGPNGTLVAVLPVQSEAVVTASRYGQTATATVSGLFVNAGLVAGAILAVLAGLGALVRRSEYSLRELLALVGWALRRAVRFGERALVALADLLDDALSELRALPGRLLAHLRDLVAGRATPADLLAALQAWLAAQRDAATAAATGLTGEAATETEVEGVAEEQLSLREAWDGLLSHTSMRPWEAAAATPGEVATHAMEVDGLPREPVETLRDAYREVEYGGRDPSERLDRASEALAAIQGSTREATTDRSVDSIDPDTEGGVAA